MCKKYKRVVPPFLRHLTRPLLSLWIFHRLLVWGRLNAPPPPMISAPGRRWEKRKAAFESSRKIISKSFQSFFGSGQNWGHRRSKLQNFPKRFFANKIFSIKVKQRILYHRVCLVKARRTIYKMTLKVKVKVWPQVKSGQGHVMTEMGHIAYHSIRLAKTNVLTPVPRLYLFLIKSYWQMTVGDLGWPQMTFRGVGNANFYSNYPQLSYTIWFHSNRLVPK